MKVYTKFDRKRKRTYKRVHTIPRVPKKIEDKHELEDTNEGVRGNVLLA